MLRVMNRLLLALVGLALTLLGLAALVGAADLPARWNFAMPSGWSWSRPQEVLLTASDRTQWRAETWWWPVVIGALALLVVLALWWVLAQLRRGRTGELALAAPGGPPAEDGPDGVLRSGALERAMGAEADALPGVARARVTLAGKRQAPRARIGVLLDAHAVPDEVVHRLDTEILEHARSSSGAGELPAEVRLRSVRRRASRVH